MQSKATLEDPAIAAEQEVSAQLEIIRLLKPLPWDNRRRIMQCLAHVVEADALVPGVLKSVVEGLRCLKN